MLGALVCLEHGWSPIPLCPHDHSGRMLPRHPPSCDKPGKVPGKFWTNYGKQRATEEEIRKWWGKNPGYNLGVVLGKLSGLMGIDIDGPEGEAELQRLSGGDLPRTWEFRTGSGGRRLLYAIPQGESLRTVPIPTAGKTLHLLCEGMQTVMPPSIHACGGFYEWICASDDLMALNTANVPNSDWSPNTTNNGYDISRVSHPARIPGWALAILRAGRVVIRQPGGGSSSERVASAGRLSLTERAALFLKECEPAISGQGGHNKTIKIADHIVNGFKQTPDAAFDLMWEHWNPRCVPPWSPAELRHKVEEGARVGTCSPKPDRNGHAPTAPKAGPIPNEDNPSPQKERKALPVFTMADSMHESPTDWLWPDRLIMGSVAILDGKKGVGKTTLMATVAAYVTGGPCLEGTGPERRTPAGVVWLQGEGYPPTDTIPRLRAAGADMGRIAILGRGADGNATQHYRFPGHVDELEGVVKHISAGLVVIDPLSSFVEPEFDLNREQHARGVLEALDALAARTHCLVLLTRHQGKAKGRDPIDAGLGSTAIGNVTRSVLLAGRDREREGHFALAVVVCNNGKPTAPLAYRMPAPDGVPRIEWAGESDKTAERLVNQPDEIGQRGAKALARRIIIAALEGKDGVPAKDVLKEGEDHGPSRCTMLTAKEELGVTSKRKTVGGRALWLWVPPQGGFPKDLIDQPLAP